MDNLAGGHVASPQWGPRPVLSTVTLAALLGALAWRLLDHNSEDRLVATVLVIVCALVTLALVRLRVRLVAGADGLTVQGVLSRRHIPWASVESWSVDARGRFGMRTPTLQIELADDELLVFGRFDLGTDPSDVAAVLSRVRR